MALPAGTLLRLHAVIEPVCPIYGVGPATVETEPGPGNVGLDFKSAATTAQRDAAWAVVAAFDWSQTAQDAWDVDQKPNRKTLRQQATQAVTDIDAYLVIADTATPAQVRTAVKGLAQITKRVILRLVEID